MEPGGKGYSWEDRPHVCEAARIKDNLMSADLLQPTFTLEMSCLRNGLLLETLPATLWSLTTAAGDGQFSTTRIAQAVASVLLFAIGYQ